MSLDKKFSKTMEQFSNNLLEILGENLLSVILFGSAVLGDFIPGKGDLDFLVVAFKDLSSSDCEKLFFLHDKMRAGRMGELAVQLEGTYYPFCIVKDPGHAEAKGCYIGTGRKGWREISSSCNSLADYAIIRAYGKFFYGKDIRGQIYNPTKEELKDEFLRSLRKSIKSAESINDLMFSISIFQWVPRGLYTLLTGKFVSKREGARWFLTEFPDSPWNSLITHVSRFRYPLSENERAEVNPEIKSKVKEFLDEIEKIAGKYIF
jgi:hypothetical protein